MTPRVVLPGLTTTPGSDWRGKCAAIDDLGIREIALFLSSLAATDRRELYAGLAATGLKSIPHVHLRDDMTRKEVRYLKERYGVKVWNIHPGERFNRVISSSWWPEVRDALYVEFLLAPDQDFLDAINKCRGLCLDVSHWEAYQSREPRAGGLDALRMLDKFPIGCCHISAVRPVTPGEHTILESKHHLQAIPDVDYARKYLKYLPHYLSIELENDFSEQMKVKEYLEKLLA